MNGVSGDSSYPAPRVGWTAVFILTTLYILSMLDRNIILVLGSDIKRDLGLSDTDLGFLYGAAFSISFGILALPLGWAVDNLSRRKIIYACVTTWSLATMACAAASNFMSLFMARVFIGAGEAGLAPSSASILSDVFPPDKLSFPLSIYFSGSKIGQSLSLIVGSWLTLLIVPSALFGLFGISVFGWQLIFLIIGLPGIALAFAIFLIPEPLRRNAAVEDGRSNGYRDYYVFVAKHKALFSFLHLGTVLYYMATVSVISWSVAFFERVHGFSAYASGNLLGGALLAAPLIGSPIHGWLVGRKIRRGQEDAPLRHMLFMGIIATPIGAGAYFVDSPVWSICLIFAFLSLLAGYSNLPSNALLICCPSNLRGKAMAVLLLFIALIGASTGPVLVAFFTDNLFRQSDRVGFSIAMVIGITVPLASASFALALAPMRFARNNLDTPNSRMI